jgi:hypothetical protein
MKTFKSYLEESEKQYTHQVVHIKTGDVVGKYTSLKSAHRAADKKDSAYGAVSHIVKPIAMKEDGIAAAGPTNAVGGGAIAGTGGKGGEPGVYLPRKKKKHDPRMMTMGKRKDF